MKKNLKYCLLSLVFILNFSTPAYAVGQGVYMRINSYFENASIRQDSSQCVDLKGQSLTLNSRIYLESESGVFSGCIAKPSSIQFTIYQGEYKIQSYTLKISAKGSSLVLNQDFSANAGLQSSANLYSHFGNGSQDFVSISLAHKVDHWQADAIEIGNKPINQVLMPGTHDTGTYAIDSNSFLTPDATSEYIGLVKNYAIGWSKTQDVDVATQLNLGIRYFDLRLCGSNYNGESTEIFTCHGFSGAKFKSVIDQISNFLNQSEHGKEIVILDMNHLYNVTDDQLTELNDYVKEKFQNKIATSKNFTPQSLYSDFWKAGKQVILSIDSHSLNLDSDLFWNQNTISSPWPNADNANDVISAMESNLKSRDMNKFFVLQSQKTPSVKNMIDGTSLGTNPRTTKEFTGKDKNAIFNWLQSNGSSLNKFGNIIIEDFSNGIDLLYLRNQQ
jgi:hypothetical protein